MQNRPAQCSPGDYGLPNDSLLFLPAAIRARSWPGTVSMKLRMDSRMRLPRPLLFLFATRALHRPYLAPSNDPTVSIAYVQSVGART